MCGCNFPIQHNTSGLTSAHKYGSYGDCVNSQFNDVRVSEELQVLNLASDLANDIESLDLLSIEDLDGHFVSRQLMYPNCTQHHVIMVEQGLHNADSGFRMMELLVNRFLF